MIDDAGSHCALLDWGRLLQDLTLLMFRQPPRCYRQYWLFSTKVTQRNGILSRTDSDLRGPVVSLR